MIELPKRLSGNQGDALRLETWGNADNTIGLYAVRLPEPPTRVLAMVHLRIDNPRVDFAGATHELIAWYVDDEQERHCICTIQIAIDGEHSDARAGKLLVTMVNGIVEGHLPLSTKMSEDELILWTETTARILRMWETAWLN